MIANGVNLKEVLILFSSEQAIKPGVNKNESKKTNFNCI